MNIGSVAAGPSMGGKNKANLYVNEAENGYLASASVSGQIPYMESGRGEGSFYTEKYLHGSSGQFVYSTLEEAFADAQKLLDLANVSLKAEVEKFCKTVGLPIPE